MSAIYIVATIIGIIGAVICYLFITQSIEKKQKQRQRLIVALRNRAKIFRYILSGFPPNFLTRELTMLVQRCLTDVLKQLASLEPKEKGHVEELAMVAQQMQATQQRSNEGKRPALQSPQQVKDVKQHLQELYKFLMSLQKRGTIKRAEADDFGDQIKQLVLKISVDSYVLQAKQARQASKPKLAIHYFTLAKKLIERDESGQFTGQLKKLTQIIEQLEVETGDQPAEKPVEPESEEWQEVETQDSWKKKNVYDE
ncbi:hypothetical protein L1F30_10310 [Simiduia sp. 21SJ11W-1]|uniref:hypothetical protein n=1 Tax=Simiduia sp. 21SJ11W-1 TaxID=2909669 RepID=UPI00209E0F6B|nr:hypothetical protein [Simiduia sp. 21SJ11W-1]UTA46559.1 hypothetical protein L1F30_10310 [Simiduia sp. 21SJ11W-1]